MLHGKILFFYAAKFFVIVFKGETVMILRTTIWFAYFWLYLIVAIPISYYISWLGKKDEKKANKFVAHFVVNWAKRLIRLAGGKIEVCGKENLPKDSSYIVVANHQGYFDIPIMLSMVGDVRGLVAKEEIKRIPFVRTWMKHLHCLFVNRGSVKAGAQTIINGTEMLKNGYGLTIFPEGTRSKGGDLKPFKAGAFRIASKAGKPIVPVTIDGSYKLLEGNPHALIAPANVKVTIHKAIETNELNRHELCELPETVRNIIKSALN